MAGEERENERGFRVQDRRRFTAEADSVREKNEVPSPEDIRPEISSSEHQPKSGEPQAAQAPRHEPLSFSSFLLGLITQALMLMGEVEMASEQEPKVDLLAARQMIDLLALLQEKTKGNLDAAEALMLEEALFDLRMRYVNAAKRG